MWKRTALALLFFFSLAIGVASTRDAAPPASLSTVLISTVTGHGSGVHIGDGFILTAAHVVDAVEAVQVKDSAGNEQTGAVLWANKAHDVALIRIADPSQISASKLICSPRLAIGDELQAVGNPVNLRFIHIWGRVSSYADDRGPWKVSVIADMTLAPGMSGGPVFDRTGGVVGIAVGVSVVSSGFSASPLAIAYFVPSSAVCMLMARK